VTTGCSLEDLGQSTTPQAADIEAIEAALASVEPGERMLFTGAGLTKHDALPRWIASAKDAGAKQIIVQATGDAFAYEGYVRALRGAGTDIFAIPLHGSIAPLHDWVSQKRGSFMETIRGIQNIRKAGGTVLVNTVIVRSNFRHLPALVGLCAKLGVRMVRLLWPHEEGVADRDLLSVTPVPDVVQPYIAQAEEEAIRVGLRLHVELPVSAELDRSAKPTEMA